MPRFVSEPVVPVERTVDAAIDGAPSLPSAFRWNDQELVVLRLRRTWRGMKVDRGDTYLKRHWFEFETADGRQAVVYFDRQAKPGAPRWWLYTISR